MSALRMVFVFAPGATVSFGGQGQVTFTTAVGTAAIPGLSQGQVAVLRAIAGGGADEKSFADLVTEHDGPAGLGRLYLSLTRFAQVGLIHQTVMVDLQPLVTLRPLTSDYQFVTLGVRAETQYVLSRFASVQQRNGELVLDSPRASAAAVLHGWRVLSLLDSFRNPVSATDLDAINVPLEPEARRAVLGVLAKTGLLELPPSSDLTGLAGRDLALAYWEPHDLTFHARSRGGRHREPYGPTYRFEGKIEPLPAVKESPEGEQISLVRPDIDSLKADDVPFTRVLEDRQSLRKPGPVPITVQQLGEFLYRVARVRGRMKTPHEEVSFRPYPGGGADYELEIYPLVNNVDGLDSGLYYYNPLRHHLVKLSDRSRITDRLLFDARSAAGTETPPQILFMMTARFQRVAYKYQSFAYAIVLKDLGALYQTMYLVATAMGLAPSAIGGGDSDLFSRASGADYYIEPAVGEFILSSIDPGELAGRQTPPG